MNDICENCGTVTAADQLRQGWCFRCRIRTVGFTFTGGGGYGRKNFHDHTIAERRNEILDGKTLGVDVVPSSEYGW